tara:strand:- start:68675 stop:69097 length:423 start_codon:yes stop_codon:yes gene_type:complete
MKYTRGTDQQIVVSNMVEVKFVDGVDDGFRKVKETLQRMGIPNRDKTVLTQSCHILHKKDRYYICHFLELFALDGREAELSEGDLGRRNLIVKCLMDWGLIEPVSNNWEMPMSSARSLKIIKYHEKDQWKLNSKYSIGSS